jgi:hypothetical protein
MQCKRGAMPSRLNEAEGVVGCDSFNRVPNGPRFCGSRQTSCHPDVHVSAGRRPAAKRLSDDDEFSGISVVCYPTIIEAGERSHT